MNCLYTSTTLLIWLRRARHWRRFFVIAPIVFGALAGWSILERPDMLPPEYQSYVPWFTALCALAAGVFPAVFDALDMNMHVDEISNTAAEFKNLQYRFRQAASIEQHSSFEQLNATFEALVDRMDAARKRSITPPEWCFEKAQKKIKAGDYDFDDDEDACGGHKQS